MKKTLTKRIYHPFWEWEELEHNIVGVIEDEGDFEQRVIEFMSDHKLWGSYMMRVVKEWKNSCEHNLTANINRQAWLGASATALALRCPEQITRKMWNLLTDEDRELANKEADKAINYWIKKNKYE